MLQADGGSSATSISIFTTDTTHESSAESILQPVFGLFQCCLSAVLELSQCSLNVVSVLSDVEEILELQRFNMNDWLGLFKELNYAVFL